MESFKSEPQFSPFSPRKPSLCLFFARSCSITLYRTQPIKIELLSYYLTIMVRYRNLVRQIGPSESSAYQSQLCSALSTLWQSWLTPLFCNSDIALLHPSCQEQTFCPCSPPSSVPRLSSPWLGLGSVQAQVTQSQSINTKSSGRPAWHPSVEIERKNTVLGFPIEDGFLVLVNHCYAMQRSYALCSNRLQIFIMWPSFDRLCYC